MITVIIPLYNKEKSILDTVNSVLNQTFQNFELLIVNDGSKDNSFEVAKNIPDERIIVLDKRNGGVSSARNFGIINAKYNYLAFLDGDDIWHPKHLEEIVRLIEYNKDIKIYCTKFVKSEHKFFVNPQFFSNGEIKIIQDFYAAESYTNTILSSSSFAIDKTILVNEDHYFNENYKFGEDVEFWYRISKNSNIAMSNNTTVIYYIASENRSDYHMPLQYRFHTFDFKNAGISEKRYLGKLVALIMVDYINYGKYSISVKIFLRYIKYSQYIFRYLILLIKKKYLK